MNASGKRVVVVGGGAAGFFAAITCQEANPALAVTILEGSGSVLSKVRVSGGGRCNVTHDQPDPALLISNYPRGSRALRGPFVRFGPRECVQWFEGRGVKLKTEQDGRMFPVTDDSETVIACLVEAARSAGVRIRTGSAVVSVSAGEAERGEAESGEEESGEAERGAAQSGDTARFMVYLKTGESLAADSVLLATGGAPAGYRWAASLGHTIEPPVPSLFTFKVDDPRLRGLAGVSVPLARVRLAGAKDTHEGPLLVTHWGLSGPAVLKASAWGARLLHDAGYRLGVSVDWRPDLTEADVHDALAGAKVRDARRTVHAAGPFGLPQRLWRSLAGAAGATESMRWADAPKSTLQALAHEVHAGRFQIGGKGVFKEEFVTCGGVRLNEVDFATMESRVRPGLHFAGEVLDIDGITGGFNFQSAWTTGWLAGRALAG